MINMTSSRRPRWLILLVVVLLLGIALVLDLTNRGLVWQGLWYLTGEEDPASQALGFVYYLGNYIRAQPDTQPMTPINHADVSPFGINTFLQQEVEVAKRERTLELIREAGFTMIRQQFPWEDIEIHGRGDFTDRRNDLNGDGTPDEISAWAKYDNIVDLADQYGITIQARLDNPPAWTHADPAIGSFAPPDDLQDYVNYVAAVGNATGAAFVITRSGMSRTSTRNGVNRPSARKAIPSCSAAPMMPSKRLTRTLWSSAVRFRPPSP